MPNHVHTPLSRQKEIEANYEKWRRLKPTNESIPDIQRTLTLGEKEMARKIFKGSIIYENVKVIRGGLFGLPNSTGNAVTPFGNIHMPNMDYDNNLDFSLGSNASKMWFIHEMAHIWQRNLGYPLVKCALGTFSIGGYWAWNPYSYDLLSKDQNKSLGQFNHEQQADIIAHYYAINFLNYQPVGLDKSQNNLIFTVLKDFIKNPANKNVLAPDIPFSPL